jgi:WhiB family transcriptional regulator, redox-sensing transcriptional regulator
VTAAVTDLFRGQAPAGDWIQQALCAETDPELFHPDKGQSNGAAKKLCARCPVQRPCLRWAVETNAGGILGGTAPRERRHLTVELVDAMPPAAIIADQRIPPGRPRAHPRSGPARRA